MNGAGADIVPHLLSITPAAGAFLWTYEADLTNDSRIDPSKTTTFFTIYDFSGFTGVHIEPAGWTFVSQLLGPTPAGTIPADSPSIVNLTWSWSSPLILGPGPFNLGDFSAVSSLSIKTSGQFTSLTTKNTVDDADGTAIANIGTTVVPMPTAVPEPSTLVLVGAGLAGLGARAWRRRRTSR